MLHSIVVCIALFFAQTYKRTCRTLATCTFVRCQTLSLSHTIPHRLPLIATTGRLYEVVSLVGKAQKCRRIRPISSVVSEYAQCSCSTPTTTPWILCLEAQSQNLFPASRHPTIKVAFASSLHARARFPIRLCTIFNSLGN